MPLVWMEQRGDGRTVARGDRIQFRNVLRARDNLYFTKVVGMQIKATYTSRVRVSILRKPSTNILTNDVMNVIKLWTLKIFRQAEIISAYYFSERDKLLLNKLMLKMLINSPF